MYLLLKLFDILLLLVCAMSKYHRKNLIDTKQYNCTHDSFKLLSPRFISIFIGFASSCRNYLKVVVIRPNRLLIKKHPSLWNGRFCHQILLRNKLYHHYMLGIRKTLYSQVDKIKIWSSIYLFLI